MGVFFSGKELVNIAVGIERNGAAFYYSLANSAKDLAIRGAYQYLSDKETEHIEVFRSLLATMGDYEPPETHTEEYRSYLEALIDSLVFTDDEAVRELAEKVGSDAEAIQIGLGAEKDSILFYSEMLEFVRSSDRDVVDRIIQEEKSHLRQLIDLKRSLS